MCGLAGFSLAPDSKINARMLANKLLTQIEYRGTHASGYAYMADDEKGGYFKAAKPGSQLSLKGLPRNAKQVILHTRFSTHGSELDNENNHPVFSSNNKVMLTHNGVAFNHDQIKAQYGVTAIAPDVDTAAIAETIAQAGVKGLEDITGYAALAWFNYETGRVLHLARPEDSPVHYAKLLDGSFVYASTAELLGSALVEAGLSWVGNYPEPFHKMQEGDYFQLVDGEIAARGYAGWGGAGYSSMYKNATSGGHGSSGRSGMYGWWRDDEWDDYEYPEVSKGSEGAIAQKALTSNTASTWDYSTEDKFWVNDHDGDYQGFASIESLASMLRWYADLSADDDSIVKSGNLKWVNHFRDVGHIDDQGEVVSWVEDSEFMNDELENLLPEQDFQMIRDGVALVRVMV